MKLSHDKILMTGATEGIGHALTSKFVSLDNTVIAIGGNGDKLKEISASEKRIIPFRCDSSKMD
jgi:short-subunit dehydrogenase involved in D-alanine esterification of teichoic acids